MMLMMVEGLLEQTVGFCDAQKFDLSEASEIYSGTKKNELLLKMLDVYKLTYRQDCERSLKL